MFVILGKGDDAVLALGRHDHMASLLQMCQHRAHLLLTQSAGNGQLPPPREELPSEEHDRRVDIVVAGE